MSGHYLAGFAVVTGSEPVVSALWATAARCESGARRIPEAASGYCSGCRTWVVRGKRSRS